MMHCNRFIGETLVRTQWLSDESVVFAAAAVYQEQVLIYKHLDEPLDMLDEGRFVFECILAGNLQAFTMCKLRSHVQETVLCICFAQPFSWKFCFMLQNELFIPSNSY